MYSPLGACGAEGQRPTSESNFLSRLRYETHLPTPGSIFSDLFLREKINKYFKRSDAKNFMIIRSQKSC